MTKQIKVMLLFGGESPEHSISISSAKNVFSAINKEKYEIYLVYVDKSGKWWNVESFNQLDNLKNDQQVTLVLGEKEFVNLSNQKEIVIDIIFPILHGENGEDGTIQGLARLTHIPVVGCKVAASAICMNKILTKHILERHNIDTVPYEVHISNDLMPSYDKISENLGKKLFVKPSNGGSSLGTGVATNQNELNVAINNAHKFDEQVLIEKCVNARELEVAILSDKNKIMVSKVGEIIPDSEFYDFDSKYSQKSESKVIIPSDIPEETSDIIRKIAKRAYKIIGCEGLARVDFFLTNEDKIYVNEINTLPGFTNISMFPKLWQHEGINYSDLIDILINSTLEN